MSALAAAARPYLAFARTSFLNILAYRARYFVGILTYFFNATVWYYIWRALFHEKGEGATLGGFTFSQMLTYVQELLSIVGGHQAGTVQRNVRSSGRVMPLLPQHHRSRTSRSATKRPVHIAAVEKNQVVRPEEILPLEETAFKDF